ncbi:unnamed protein product [Lactuca saligna]|uniref:PPM-type phosphatase domain-containing protein n=1 Tax=Lactuca saligna TaxID=75948 RepID=A0AA35YYT6_LACSI|nr:unnamed protein product [Lactuca saligna]
MSGTTAIIVLVITDKLYVANAGNSRALISVKPDHQGFVTQHTHNHPFFVLASDDIFEFLSSQTVVDSNPKNIWRGRRKNGDTEGGGDVLKKTKGVEDVKTYINVEGGFNLQQARFENLDKCRHLHTSTKALSGNSSHKRRLRFCLLLRRVLSISDPFSSKKASVAVVRLRRKP